VLLDDTYNNDLQGVMTALDALQASQDFQQKTIILSDIIENNHEIQEKNYTLIAAKLQEINHAKFIAIGEQLWLHKDKFGKKSFFYKSTDDFLKMHNFLFQNELILLKGARTFHFEKIVATLEQGNHHTYLEVNLNMLLDNYLHIKQRLKPNTKVMAMVKAFAYGAGSYEVAQVLVNRGIDYLGVAFVEEGIYLRKKGINCPILVMSVNPDDFQACINYQLDVEINNFEQIKALQPLPRINVHIKINTGMNRLGFSPENIYQAVEQIIGLKHVNIIGIMTHLAAADDPTHDSFTNTQISIFEEITEHISKKYNIRPLRHALNSAGIARFTAHQFDMVRTGISLYISEKENVLVLKSTIAQIQTLKPKQTVGYNRKWQATEATKIAIVNIGYADGLRRSLGNGQWQVVIEDKLFPIVGQICMDICMVNIGKHSFPIGSEVIIFGTQANSIQMMAQKLDTITYEIVTNVSTRVKRKFVLS